MHVLLQTFALLMPPATLGPTSREAMLQASAPPPTTSPVPLPTASLPLAMVRLQGH